MVTAASPGASQPPAFVTSDNPEACGSVEDCIARLTGPDRTAAPPLAWVGDRLVAHGQSGADALIPLLTHPSEEVRRRAVFALEQFEELPARHAGALIAAHRRGLEVANAIARTGSDEALRYLEEAWSFSDDGHRVRQALPLFEERAYPFLLRELERCREGCARREASALIHALGQIDGPLPDRAQAVIRDVAASPAAEPDLRREMEDQLIFRADRAALPILVRRLAAARGVEGEEWLAARLIESIQRHREAARGRAGPLLLSYLGRPEPRQARIQAVIAALEINYRASIPALRALLAQDERDWLATYHAVWALAELDAIEARPAIARVARDHWYLPVRNNARRALNMLDGSGFELPELGAEDDRGPYAGELNFARDLAAARDCRFDRAQAVRRVARDAPVPLLWPAHGAVRIELAEPTLEARGLLTAAPDLPREAKVTLLWQREGERVVGVDADRWAGGLFAIGADGRARRLLEPNVLAAFEVDDTLFILTGAGAQDGGGDLWMLPGRGRLVAAERPLRLPARPEGFAIASDRTLLVRTERGDVGISRSGRPLPPQACPAASPAQ